MKSFIVEGPDNSGKSTLVAALAKALAMKVVHNTKPTCIEEFKDVLKAEVESNNTIFDRGMAISQVIYDIALNRCPLAPSDVMNAYVELELRCLPVIICLPPEHVVCSAPKDRPEMVGVAESREQIYEAYSGFVEGVDGLHSVVIYDYMKHSVEDAVEWLINAMGISDVQ